LRIDLVWGAPGCATYASASEIEREYDGHPTASNYIPSVRLMQHTPFRPNSQRRIHLAANDRLRGMAVDFGAGSAKINR
jgi:hypothetical protein